MSIRDIELENSLERINQLEAIISLSILKDENPQNVQEISQILKNVNLSLCKNSDPSSENLDPDKKFIKIKSLLNKSEKKEKEKKFDFEIKTFSMESVLDDLNKLSFKLSDYMESYGTTNIIYLSKTWLDGTAEFKRDNLRKKYVKLGDQENRVGFTVANSYSYGIQLEIKKCISYIDSEKKIINWEAVMEDLKSLSKSSGYTEGDVHLALMGFLRLGGLNQDLYSHMHINEIADSLIKSVKPIHKSTVFWGALRKLTREVNTPLQLILSEAESYIRKIFPDPNQQKVRENYHFVALTSFVNDKISLEVTNDIKRKKELNQDYYYEHYKDMCLRLEQNDVNIPTEPLKYGRNAKKSSVQEFHNIKETHNLHNIQSKNILSVDNNSDDEEFEFTNACFKRRQPIYSSKVNSLDQEQSGQGVKTLGTCFGDRSEDDITTYIKFNNNFYCVPLKDCDLTMQLALIQAMKAGRINQNVSLLWDDNVEYMMKISKDEFNTAKTIGCKPDNTWIERREHVLKLTLTTEINKTKSEDNLTSHNTDRNRSDSDDYNSLNGSNNEESSVIELNNTNIRDSDKRNGYFKYPEMYKPFYNNDKKQENQYGDRGQNKTNDRDAYYRFKNGNRDNKKPYQDNTIYYRNRSKSPNGYSNSYNYRYDNNYNGSRQASQERREYRTNGYSKSPNRYYSKTYNRYGRSPSSKFRGDTDRRYRSPSWSRSSGQIRTRPRSQSENNRYVRNSYDRDRNNSYDRDNQRQQRDRNDSYDRNSQRQQRENRERSKSSDKYDRPFNKYDNTSYGRDKQRQKSTYNREDRSKSSERNGSKERGRSIERRRPNYNRERSYDKTDSAENRGRITSRDRSLEIRLRYPKFKPGDNCDVNYNPRRNKLCRKCTLKGVQTHHEFECKKFTKFNDNPCKKCHNGFHFEKECSNSNASTYNTDTESEEKNDSLG